MKMEPQQSGSHAGFDLWMLSVKRDGADLSPINDTPGTASRSRQRRYRPKLLLLQAPLHVETGRSAVRRVSVLRRAAAAAGIDKVKVTGPLEESR